MRGSWIAVCALPLGACSFKSGLDIRVDVYGGPVENVVVQPDPRLVMSIANELSDQCANTNTALA